MNDGKRYQVLERVGTGDSQPVPLVGKQKAVLTRRGARMRLDERIAHWMDQGANWWRRWEAEDGSSSGFVAERDGVFVASAVRVALTDAEPTDG